MGAPSAISRVLIAVALGAGLMAGPGVTPVSAVGAAPSAAEDAPIPPGTAAAGVSPTEDALSNAEKAALVEASSTGKDVPVDALTTPSEVTVAHPDGTFTRTLNAEPVRMKTGSGWDEISTDLIPVTEGGERVLKPEMTPVEVTLGTEGSSTMSTIEDGQGHAITQSWPFGELPAPSVEGDTATYASVLPGVDLIQIAHNTGVSQVLKIADANAARDPRVAQMRIFLDAQNATVSGTSNGGLQAKGKDSGVVELRTAAGQWWDSSEPGASASDPGGPGITRPFALSLGSEDGQQTQKFGMKSILDTKGLVYPLYVDPDWSATRTSYVYVDSAYPGTSYWNGQYTDATGHVGFLPASWAPDGINHTTRTYYQFVTSPLAGKVILSARMDAVETWASSCTPTPVSAWVTGGVGSGTTWNAQPGMLKKVSTQTVAKGYTGCAAGTVGFDMGGATDWLTSSAQWTIALRADNEGDPLGWKRFSNNPTMRVTYDTKPNTPSIWTITAGQWKGTPWAAGSIYLTRLKAPTYYVKASDPDGTAGGNIWVTFKVKTAAGTVKYTSPAISGSPASGTMFSWQGGSLADGKYILEAQTKDQQGEYSGVMSFPFTVDTTPPPPPAITAVTAALNPDQTDPNGVVGETVYELTLAKGSGSYDVEGFIYAVADGPSAATYPAVAACDKRDKEFVFACSADGKSAKITVAAIDLTTTVTVWAYDYAGNVNQQVNSAPASYTFTVGNEAAAPSTVLPVTLHGAAKWVQVETRNSTPVPNSCTGSLAADADVPEQGTALQLSGSGAYADTLTAGADTSKSFSISGWFCATAPASSPAQALVTQMAGAGSPGGGLGINSTGNATFTNWTGLNSAGPDTVARVPALAPGSWYFISAVSDRINRQMRLTVTGDGYTGTWTIATASTTHVAAGTTQPVLLGATAGSGTSQFTGQILNPIVAGSVLTPYQFRQAQTSFGTTPGVKK